MGGFSPPSHPCMDQNGQTPIQTPPANYGRECQIAQDRDKRAISSTASRGVFPFAAEVIYEVVFVHILPKGFSLALDWEVEARKLFASLCLLDAMRRQSGHAACREFFFFGDAHFGVHLHDEQHLMSGNTG